MAPPYELSKVSPLKIVKFNLIKRITGNKQKLDSVIFVDKNMILGIMVDNKRHKIAETSFGGLSTSKKKSALCSKSTGIQIDNDATKLYLNSKDMKAIHPGKASNLEYVPVSTHEFMKTGIK